MASRFPGRLAPTALAVGAALLVSGPWVAERLARFTSQLLLALPGATT